MILRKYCCNPAIWLLLAFTLLGVVPQISAQTHPGRKLSPPQRAKTPARKRKASKAVKRPSKPAARTKSRTSSANQVYRLGHGNRGIGTIKPPARYVAPAPIPAPSPVAASGVSRTLQFPAQLDSFFTRLQQIEVGDNQQTVRILQFGDSHTAADMFTGRMRSLFQQRFGNGGAGFTFAGHPFPGYRILGTSRSQTSGWIDEGVHFTKIVNTELGLGGVANTSTQPGDSVTLDAPCARIEVQYLNQPDGGSFSVSEDGKLVAGVSTDDAVAPKTFESPCNSGSSVSAVHHFEISVDSTRPVRLFGTITEQPGITYEALGLNGAEASLILRWDRPIFTGYLRQRAPGLIVLAYGTNEASNHNWTYEAYSDLMGRVVDMLHATAPDSSIVVVGPPDRSLRVGRRRSAHWQTFSETVHISDAQRDVCRTHGCSFWDWRARMGGLGSINRWVSNGLAQADHTHFNSAGYVQLADLFYSDIIAAYDVWKLAHPSTLSPPISSPSSR